jgi:hypothetical protein
MKLNRLHFKDFSIPRFASLISNSKIFSKFTAPIILANVIFLFVLTSALVPSGSGPDAGAHMVNTYCAFGTKNGMCEVVNLDKVVFREVKVPRGTHDYGACFIFSVEIGASCAEPYRSDGVNSISFKTTDFKEANNEVLFVQRVGRDVYHARLFGNNNQVTLKMYLNSNAISSFIDLDKSKLECAWPCKNSDTSDSKIISDQNTVLTFIPQLSTRSIQLYLNGELAFISENKFKAYTSASLGPFVSSKLSAKVDSETLKDIWQVKFKSFSEAYMTDNYNPPLIYKFYNLLISKDVALSYLQIKIVLILLLGLSLLLVYSLFGRSGSFYVFINALLISSVIYGFYIFGTNNTSNLSYLGTLLLSILPIYFHEGGKKNYRSHAKFIILFVISLAFASGRTDGLIFAFVGYTLYSAIKIPRKENYIPWAFTLLILFLSGLSVYRKYQVAVDIHASKSPIESLSQVTLHNFLEILGVIAGLLGSRGPLGIWGFGITEPLPMVVFLLNFSAIILILVFVIFTSSVFQKIVLLTSFIAIYTVFAATISSPPEAPSAGGWMMPRYGLSLYGIFILVLVQLFADNFHKLNFQIKYLNVITRTISFFFASGVSIAFYFLAAKHMNGLMIDYNDSFLPNIISLGPWIPQEVVKFRLIDESYGWKPYIPLPINYILIMIFVLFYVTFNFSLKRSIRDNSYFSKL